MEKIFKTSRKFLQKRGAVKIKNMDPDSCIYFTTLLQTSTHALVSVLFFSFWGSFYMSLVLFCLKRYFLFVVVVFLQRCASLIQVAAMYSADWRWGGGGGWGGVGNRTHESPLFSRPKNGIGS